MHYQNCYNFSQKYLLKRATLPQSTTQKHCQKSIPEYYATKVSPKVLTNVFPKTLLPCQKKKKRKRTQNIAETVRHFFLLSQIVFLHSGHVNICSERTANHNHKAKIKKPFSSAAKKCISCPKVPETCSGRDILSIPPTSPPIPIPRFCLYTNATGKIRTYQYLQHFSKRDIQRRGDGFYTKARDTRHDISR